MSKNSIKLYLNELSSNNSVPGGGSAAALVGALGAGLLEKTCNLTIGKEKYKPVEKEIKVILKKLNSSRKRLEQLIKEDSVYYLKLVKAYRLKRPAVIKKADAAARRAPAEIKNICESLLSYCDILEEKANKFLVSDVKCARELLKAASIAAKNFV